jgi:hypothetical protein
VASKPTAAAPSAEVRVAAAIHDRRMLASSARDGLDGRALDGAAAAAPSASAFRLRAAAEVAIYGDEEW